MEIKTLKPKQNMHILSIESWVGKHSGFLYKSGFF